MKKLQKLLEELTTATAESNRLDALYEQNPENEEIENAFDAAYQTYWYKAEEVATEIKKVTGIDKKTALKMAFHKQDEISELLGQMA